MEMLLTKKYFHITVLQWILLIFCIFILIIYIRCHYFTPHPEKYVKNNGEKLKWITLKEVMDNAENGDVIFMSGDTSGERTCRWFAGCIFSHIGFLFREKQPVTGEDEVYIFDCDMGQGSKEGARVMPLRYKLDRYKGFRIGAIKKLNLLQKIRPSHDDVMGLVQKYIPIKFDEKITSWWFANWPSIYSKVKNKNEMFCSELVATIYQDLGILKKDRVAAWYHPGDFYSNKLHFELGFSLGETQFFEFPKNETTKLQEELSPIETGLGDISLSSLPGLEKEDKDN